jgi:hypothetical protein
MIQYVLIVTLFATDGSTSEMRPGEPGTYQDCSDQITDAYAGEYADSILTCEPIHVEDDPEGEPK